MTSQFTTIITIIKPTPVLGRKVLVSKFKTWINKSERFIIHWAFELKIGRLLNHAISKTTKRTAGWLAIKDHRATESRGALAGELRGAPLIRGGGWGEGEVSESAPWAPFVLGHLLAYERQVLGQAQLVMFTHPSGLRDWRFLRPF